MRQDALLLEHPSSSGQSADFGDLHGPCSSYEEWQQQESRLTTSGLYDLSRTQAETPSLASLNFPPPHAAQQTVLDASQRFNVVDCGRRWGKTELAMRKLAETALAGEPAAYLSPIYPMLTEVYRALRERLLPLVTRSVEGRRLELSTGGIIDLWSMENGADRVRGRKYRRVVLDECAMVVDLLALWEKVVRPTLTDLKGDAWFLSTPRRGSGFEELYRRTDDGWASWQMPTRSNPFIDADEIEAARQGMSDQSFAQEYLADFEASESDLVYPEFDRLVHVKTQATAWADCKWRVVGIDPGGGDPTAIVPLGVDGREHIHQYGEFYRRGDVSIETIAEELGRYNTAGRLNVVVVGETGGNIITNTLRAMGFPAVKAEMGRKEGLEVVRMLLQRGRLTIDPDCRNSIAEFNGYRWDKRRDQETGERYATSTPADHHADAMDARRYAAMAVITQMRAPGNVRLKYAS